jgi:hypothetical protein
LDWDDQIVDPDWAAEKLTQWFSPLDKGGFNATMHQMHSPILAPAGKGKDLFFDGGVPHVRAKIVEPTAVKLIDEDVYGAFSIGILDPPIFPDPSAKNGRIGRKGAGGFINEVSLVDVPANPRCLFSMAKRRGTKLRSTGKVRFLDESGHTVNAPDQITKAFIASLTKKRKKGKKDKDWAAYDEERGGGGKPEGDKPTDSRVGTMGGTDMYRKPEGTLSTKPNKKMAAKIGASAAWYAIYKRDMDPDVGGGVDRDKLDASDYVFGDTRTFPVVTPGDVSDAVSSWGRYKGAETFESFKSKLTALAHRKGPAFVKELPASWGAKPKKKGRTMSAKTQKAKEPKAKKDGGDSKPDGAKCPLCKGEKTIRDGNMKCPKCKGSGLAAGGDPDKAAKARAMAPVLQAAADATAAGNFAGGGLLASAVGKSLTKDADDDVDDAIEDAAEDLSDAMSAQADDEAEDGDKPSDQAVDQALETAAGALSAVAAAQGADELSDVLGGKKKSKKGKKKGADMSKIPTGDTDTCSKCGKTHKGKCKAAKGKIPPQFLKEDEKQDDKKKGKKSKKKGQGNGAGGGNAGANVDPDVGASTDIPSDTAVMTGGIGKKKKRKGIPSLEKRLHDMLCPSYGGKAIKNIYGSLGKDLPVPQVLDPEYFGMRLAELSAGKGKGDIAEAFADLQASTKLATLSPKTFGELRDAAAKNFMDAYPGVHLKPEMIDPEDFKRSFLSSATPETSSVTRVPMPDLKDMFGPHDFQRGPLTTNEARPTLSSGSSVAKTKKTKGNTAGAGNPNSRAFYTNAAKDESQNAMAMLHDHIVSRYPGVCPMEAVQPGTDIDRDGLAGSAAELQAKGPGVESLPTPSGASDSGTLRPVGKSKADKKKTETPRKGVGKGAGKAPTGTEAIKGLVDESIAKALKPAKRRNAKLGKSLARTKRQLKKTRGDLDKALSQPAQRSRAHRGPGKAFTNTPSADPEKVLEGKQAAERIRTLKNRAHDGNSSVAMAAMEELREILTPAQLGAVMAADVD